MKKYIVFILIICNYLPGFSQLEKTAEIKLPGNRNLYRINQYHLLITEEITDTGGYSHMELSLYDSSLCQKKVTSLEKVKGYLNEVFITSDHHMYVLYRCYDNKSLLGSTMIFCIDENLRLTRTSYFSLPYPGYSIHKLKESGRNELFMYGRFLKSNEDFIVKLNTKNNKLVKFPVTSSFRDKKDDFDWVLEWESFPGDHQTFIMYNNEKGKNDSTYLRIYSNEGKIVRTMRIKLGERMMIGSARFYRESTNHYIVYGRYWQSVSDHPETWGIYLFRLDDGEVSHIITKPITEFPLNDRYSLDHLGLPLDKENLKITLDSFKRADHIENSELYVINEMLTKNDKNYFLTGDLWSGNTEGGLVVEFDSSFQYKRSVVFPIVYGPRSGNHQYSDFPSGWTDHYFNQCYFLNNWLTGCIVDSSFRIHPYWSVNPDPSWSVIHPSKAMLWYDHFLILYGNDDDWQTKSDTFFFQKLVLPVK